MSFAETALLVDDDPLLRATLGLMLEKLGFRVLMAEDGCAALALAAREPSEIHLAVADFVMPKLDGVQTLLALRQARPAMGAILCSGTARSDCFRTQPLPDCTFLSKPFTFEDLQAAIRGARVPRD